MDTDNLPPRDSLSSFSGWPRDPADARTDLREAPGGVRLKTRRPRSGPSWASWSSGSSPLGCGNGRACWSGGDGGTSPRRGVKGERGGGARSRWRTKTSWCDEALSGACGSCWAVFGSARAAPARGGRGPPYPEAFL